MIAAGADRFRGVEMFALIGETLRRLRRDKRLTLEQLGETAELGRGQLSRIENNRQEATLSTLAKILGAQGVSRKEFFRRYDLVESEALEVERQQEGGVPSGQGDWPREIQEVLGRVESFVHTTLHQPTPVAQGAIEVGDLVVLFRVVPKSASPAPGSAPEAPDPEPKPARRAAKRKR
jgi:transcriptional regulator with XRE-family HTH domain